MHDGTCVTPGSLTSGFLWSRWRGYVPGIPGACATRNFTYLVRGPLLSITILFTGLKVTLKCFYLQSHWSYFVSTYLFCHRTVIKRSNIAWFAHITAVIESEYKREFEPAKDIPYLALTDENGNKSSNHFKAHQDSTEGSIWRLKSTCRHAQWSHRSPSQWQTPQGNVSAITANWT